MNLVHTDTQLSRSWWKRVTTLAIIILSFLQTSFAQTIITVGTASSTASTLGPTTSTSTTTSGINQRHTAIYSATELSAAGLTSGSTLFSLAWNKSGEGAYTGTDLTVRIWLKSAASTSFAANPSFNTETGAATLVYETTAGSIAADTGLVRFVFNTNTYVWNGDNLQVITEIIRPSAWANTSFSWRTLASITNTGANASSAGGTDALSRTGTRPQIILEAAASGADAALTGMPNPVPTGPGTQAVEVVLRNTGNVILNTADINWTVNGTAQPVYNWNGSLLPGQSVTVSIGSAFFGVGISTITATVNNPNGTADVNPANNNVSKTIAVCNPLFGTYTIDKGSPTSGTNFNSFNDLASFLASCGVTADLTVNVVPNSGPYNEQVDFRNITGLGGGASITINGNGNTLTATTTTSDRYVLRLSDVSYFTINNLKIQQGAFTLGWIGVHLFRSGNHITLNGLEVTMNPATSVLIGGIVGSGDPTSFTDGGVFSDIHYSNNTVTGGGKGINIYGTAASPVTNLVIDHNTINGTGSDGIFFSYANGAQVNNNTINFTTGDGIEVYQNTSNSQVYSNQISATNPTGSATIRGIYVNASSVTGARVYNNLIWKMMTPAANVYGLASGSAGGQFLFNTVILDDASATGNVTAGFLEDATNTTTLLRNNIFYITRPGAVWSSAISLSSSSTVTTAINADNNVYYTTTASIGNKRQITTANPPAAIYATLPDWRTASGKDANSFATDPLFQANTGIPTSGIINNSADASTGVTEDITGANRSGSPDPGAYEFSAPGLDASITRLIVPARPYCNTTLAVEFELTNAGTDPITSATINWKVNGIAQAPYNWTGVLGSGASVTVQLGTIPVTGNNAYDLEATVINPNGTTDANAINDKFFYAGFRRGMNGGYTIDKTQPLSSTNYQTFQKLSEDLSFYGLCGPITVMVSGGPYTEQVVFSNISGTSSSNTVTLDGNGQTLQFNPTVSTSDYILQLNGVNYMTVQNFVINSLHATQGRGIHITNNASNLVIRNNTVNVSTTNTSSSSFGIIVSGANYLLDGSLSENLTITGNTVTGGYSGIQITGNDFNSVANKVRNSVISDNTIRDFYGFGIYLNYTDNVVVSKNRISRPARTNSGSDSQTPAGIIVSAGSTSFLLDKNRIADLYNSSMNTTELAKIARGFYISGTSTAVTTGTLQNNLVYGSSNTGTQYAIQDNAGGNGNTINIYHNTLALNNQTMAGSASSSVINLSGSSAGGSHNIQNNILYLSRSGTGTKRLIDVSSANTPVTSNYNVFYFGTSTGTLQLGRVNTTNYLDLAAWQGTGKDANSLYADPIFMDASVGNFRPQNGSVDGNAMGTSSVGVTDDILDALRSGNPDPGAYESSTPAPVNLYLFSGVRKGANNELRWTTASETDNKGFELERSVDGINYRLVAFVASLSATGNSSWPLSYIFTDGNFSGEKQWYRLKQIDRSGHYSYSKVVVITRTGSGDVKDLTGLYPNPVSASNVNVLLYSPQNDVVNLQITDAAGRVLVEQKIAVGAGNNTLPVTVTSLSKGLYFVKIKETKSEGLAFIKQ